MCTKKQVLYFILSFAIILGATSSCGARNKSNLVDFDYDWPTGLSPQEIAPLLIEQFLSTNIQIHRSSNMIHYVETCVWQGALRYAKQTNDDVLLQRLIDRFDLVFTGEPPFVTKPLNVDATVFGAVPLELYMRTGDERFLNIGLALADAQWTRPDTPLPVGMAYTEEQIEYLTRISREAEEQGHSWQTRYWIDDMYMITMLQAQAYRATGNRNYLDRTAVLAVSYLDKLQQPNGLFFHATDAPFFWGRGNGWFASGITELLRALPPDHEHFPRIKESYRKMMYTLLEYQDSEGKWRQLIDDPTSWQESSSTAMFTFAFATGVRHGWLDAATFGPAARKGWLALVSWLEPDGRVRDVCEGTNARNCRDFYLQRGRITGDKHGQAPIIWTINAFME
jgi:rhamnogalacturonyl hydrolase YesR